MKNGNIEILDLDFEYKLWKNRIASMLTEVNLFVDRIHIIKREHENFSVDESVFILLDLQQKALEKLINNIRTHEQEIAFYAEDYPILNSHSHYAVHENIRAKVDIVINRHHEIFTDVLPQLCYPMEIN